MATMEWVKRYITCNVSREGVHCALCTLCKRCVERNHSSASRNHSSESRNHFTQCHRAYLRPLAAAVLVIWGLAARHTVSHFCPVSVVSRHQSATVRCSAARQITVHRTTD